MNKKLITSSVLAAILMTGGAVGLASAQSATQPANISLSQAIDIALAEVPGEVREAELEREYGKPLYEIEIIKADGIQMEVEVDAETGKVMEVETSDRDDDDDDDHRKKSKS